MSNEPHASHPIDPAPTAVPPQPTMRLGKRDLILLPVLMGLGTFLVNNVASPVAQGLINRHFNVQDRAEERARVEQERASERARVAINAFLSAANDFDTLSGDFVLAVAERREVPDDLRRRLLANMRLQAQLLSSAARSLRPEDQADVARYEAAIDRMVAAIPGVRDVVTMRAYWESVSALVVARGSLVRKFERAAG